MALNAHEHMFDTAQRSFGTAIAGLATANPFRPESVARFERDAEAVDLPADHAVDSVIAERPRIGRLVAKASSLLESVSGRNHADIADADLVLHGEVVRFVLYFRFRDRLQSSVDAGFANPESVAAPWFDEFHDAFRTLSRPARNDDPLADPGHVFAAFFQIRRAYHLIHSQFAGTSRPIRDLQAAAWESVFTTDMLQYGRLLFDRMQDVTTLVVGPTGTGKELVARAVGLSRFIPFETRTRRFAEPFAGAFRAVNVSALSPTLVESELFGHAKGSFTGATAAREGWFESCRAGHAVFLDEIGELDPSLQVKLLRVLQERVFQRLGEVRSRRFEGKVIAATNRDLAEEMEAGRFREDFYYRLCSDVIRTPSLRSQLDDAPADLDALVAALVTRQVGRPAPEVADRVSAFVRRRLPDHPWPGNVRELEQCVRSVLVRGSYEPTIRAGATPRERFARRVARATPTADELLDDYCKVLHEEIGTYAGVARVLGLDRRTVQKRVES